MKRFLVALPLPLFLLVLVIVCTGCAGGNPNTETKTEPVVAQSPGADAKDDMSAIDKMRAQDEKERMWVGESTYHALLRVVVKRGHNISDNDKQFTYFDKSGNRHGVVLIYDKPNHGSRGLARPVQISVWVNGKEALKGKKFFFYSVHPDGMCYSQHPDKFPEIQRVINEMLRLKLK